MTRQTYLAAIKAEKSGPLFIRLRRKMKTTTIIKRSGLQKTVWTGLFPQIRSVDYNSNKYICQQSTFSSPSQQFLGILQSLLPFIGNLPFIHHPNSCIVVSVALLWGLRYKEIVTLKRIYILEATVWIDILTPLLPQFLISVSPLFIARAGHWYHFHCSFHSPRSQRFFALSDIFRHKYKIVFNNSWANQMHWTWRDTEKQCTVGTVSFSCLLYTTLYCGNRSHL